MSHTQISKSLVVGASGMVGSEMLAALDGRALATSRRPRPGWITFDLADLANTSQAAAAFDAQELNAIYCVGGMTYVDGCEADPDQAKLLYCTAGAIYDVALDLRVGSPTYGKHEVYELSSLASNAVYLPRGIAHGFCVREAPAVMVYHVTSEHDPSRDAGIHWNSFGAAWPVESPVVSNRDDSFVALGDFESPFVYATR